MASLGTQPGLGHGSGFWGIRRWVVVFGNAAEGFESMAAGFWDLVRFKQWSECLAPNKRAWF